MFLFVVLEKDPRTSYWTTFQVLYKVFIKVNKLVHFWYTLCIYTFSIGILCQCIMHLNSFSPLSFPHFSPSSFIYKRFLSTFSFPFLFYFPPLSLPPPSSLFYFPFEYFLPGKSVNLSLSCLCWAKTPPASTTWNIYHDVYGNTMISQFRTDNMEAEGFGNEKKTGIGFIFS